MNKFPVFWYESNACWGEVKSIEALQEKCDMQTHKIWGGLKDKAEFLDESRQNLDGSLDFGTRGEHRGNKTLRQFLSENNIEF